MEKFVIVSEEYGEVSVSNVSVSGEFNLCICGYPAYINILWGSMKIKLLTGKIGERKKVSFIKNNFPKKRFIKHLIAARIRYRLSISDIKEIATALDYLRK